VDIYILDQFMQENAEYINKCGHTLKANVWKIHTMATYDTKCFLQNRPHFVSHIFYMWHAVPILYHSLNPHIILHWDTKWVTKDSCGNPHIGNQHFTTNQLYVADMNSVFCAS
jgi:hypothetical protein